MSKGRHRLFDAKRRDGRMVYMGPTGKFITQWRGMIYLRNGMKFGPVFGWGDLEADR